MFAVSWLVTGRGIRFPQGLDYTPAYGAARRTNGPFDGFSRSQSRSCPGVRGGEKKNSRQKRTYQPRIPARRCVTMVLQPLASPTARTGQLEVRAPVI